MKKYLIIIVALIGFTMSASATDYRVFVTIRYTLEYYDLDNNYQFSEDGGGQNQSIYVVADSEVDAKVKAIEKCKEICRNKEDLGVKPKNGKQYKVYRVTATTIEKVYKNDL
jgi:hypothetical protein